MPAELYFDEVSGKTPPESIKNRVELSISENPSGVKCGEGSFWKPCKVFSFVVSMMFSLFFFFFLS